MISIIVAIANGLAIGKDNRLLCNIPGDLKRFKEITSGHAVIMGKRTWESLPSRPLPNRRNIVITDIKGELFEGAISAYSIQEAIDKGDPDAENFIIGGGMIYRQFLPYAHKLYLTRVHKDFEADTWFPEINFGDFNLVSSELHSEYQAQTGFEFSYEIWQRK